MEGNAKYLALVRERIRQFSDALAVHFPSWAPHLALIELPGEVDCMPVDRRRVTDLLEFERPEAPPDDELDDQLEFEWPSSARLEDPPMTTRVTNPERKMVSRRKAS